MAIPSAATGAKAKLIGLAVLTAAGWGLGPVLIDLAADAYGRVTATMMILSQVCGAVMLGAILLWRRPGLAARPLTPEARRKAVWLIVLAGLLEAMVSVLFYLTIVALGPVLAMLIMATTPVFSIVFGVVFLRERPRPAPDARRGWSPWPECSSPPRRPALTGAAAPNRSLRRSPGRALTWRGRTACGARPPS